MRLNVSYLVVCLVLVLSFGCSSTIQTDKTIKEERSSSAATGPVMVKATVKMNDGAPVRNRSFHLISISRDSKGEMNQVIEMILTTAESDANGNLNFPIPRDTISGVKEFSFGTLSANLYGGPMVIRRKDAKEMLTFKADEKTKAVDLGEVFVSLR